LEVLEGHTDAVLTCAYNYAGDRIVTAGRDNTVRQWKAGEISHRENDL
jgi:dynein assembly factor with WDR repeat domains 1